MAEITVSDERTIEAPADTVYRVIADYVHHHAHILPDAFSDLAVVEGGYGAGTVVTFALTLSRRTTTHRATIAEPQPGRVLTETDERMRSVTTFTVTPDGDGLCRVKIATSFPRSPGLRGVGEKVFAGRVLLRLYREELRELNAYVKTLPAN